ncbi:cytochrome c biogenesis protein CcsA [Aquimarina sediminis]|uniref:cytochrome c biogenesis protein CcsA n=1 Tax=Aquimarina sediminis TaxID=2070536 RepID=UPI000CA045D9|nr:cytochrome c biogenesis protein CcsA [Aquimarina sediminis]
MKLLNATIHFLLSTRLTAFLFLIFAFALGMATFIENDYNTETAKTLIYNAWWFNVILFLFILNFIGNVKRYRLYKKDKVYILVLHFAFIIILVGAAITRYISFEGIISIKENETSSTMLSEKKYLSVAIDNGLKTKTIEKKLLLSQTGVEGYKPLELSMLNFLSGGNHFQIHTDFDNEPFEISYLGYVPNAKIEFKENESSRNRFLHLVESSRGVRSDKYLKKNDYLTFFDADISFQNIKEGVINIYSKENQLYIKAHRTLKYVVMANQETGVIMPNTAQVLKYRTLYTLGSLQFVIPEPLVHGYLTYKTSDAEEFPLDMLSLRIKTKDISKDINVFGAQFFEKEPKRVKIGSLNFAISYGSKQVKLPFEVRLNDFVLERYPGSESPKSFTSKLSIKDKSESFDTDVYMNNVLDFKGYRLFQSSYDEQNGIESTILSVNHDMLGTWVTYVGYSLLFTGLILMLITHNSYFGKQRKRLKKIKNLTFFLLLISPSLLLSQTNDDHTTDKEVPDIFSFTEKIPLSHAEQFGRLIVQDPGGRMKPVNTFGSEFLRKVAKKNHFRGLNSDQIILSIFLKPESWKNIPIIYIKKNNTKVRDFLGIPHSHKYVKLSSFFNKKGEYLLKEEVFKASKKKIKRKYDQSVLDIDGRVVLLYLATQGDLFRIIPIPKDSHNTWVNQNEAIKRDLTDVRLSKISSIISNYKKTFSKGVGTANLKRSFTILEKIEDFQKSYGKSVIPSKEKINLELFYNKYDIFKNLFWQYMLASLFLFVIVIISVFKNKSKLLHLLTKIGISLIILLFVYHAIGLGIRWYISGHAPWSNGYESMIYVAWSTLLFGLLFGRKSGITIAATSFVASMILMVAHWNWMDPSIGNLVPVLDSYWLMIHVAIIVASYGPFAIGMILGMINLLLFALFTKKNKKKLNKIISELTIINELSLTIGLVMLTIGNFLGGIWANESWGRYWGWDPKETWALISIMIYSFIIHARLVPGLRGKLTFNAFSIFAFTSILMTYLGVNHLLSGLHSYAKGDSAPIPLEIWSWLIISMILVILAKYKQQKLISN